jgi:hypothetical protein
LPQDCKFYGAEETTKETREQPLFLDEELQKQLDKAQRVLGLPPIRFAETSKN